MCNPIVTKLYQGGAPPEGMPGGEPAAAAGGPGPKIEEVGESGVCPLPFAFCFLLVPCVSPASAPQPLGSAFALTTQSCDLGLLVPANQACKPAAAATHPAAHSLTPATPCPSFCSALQTNCTDREDELGPHSALVSREPRASQIDFELPLPCKTKQRNWAGEQQAEQSRAEQGPQAGRAGSSRTVAWQGQHW